MTLNGRNTIKLTVYTPSVHFVLVWYAHIANNLLVMCNTPFYVHCKQNYHDT